MIDNIIMSIDANMLIRIVLWLSKHAYANNCQHSSTTQHLNQLYALWGLGTLKLAEYSFQLHIFESIIHEIILIKKRCGTEMIIISINMIKVIIIIIVLNSERHIQSSLTNNHQCGYNYIGIVTHVQGRPRS